MISPADVYNIFTAIVPLYAAMILAYTSVKWWKLFSPDQCSGINKFVANFSIPLLSFHIISTNNPYQMNLKLIFADALQKLLVLVTLTLWKVLSSRGSVDWLITGFSLSTLPNTLVMGIPLMRAMYGEAATSLLAQIVVLQSIVWYTLLPLLFELRAAKIAEDDQIPAAASPVMHLNTVSIDSAREDADSMIPVVSQVSEVSGKREAQRRDLSKGIQEDSKAKSPRKNRTNIIMFTVLKKILQNPNAYSSAIGLIWALISFRWSIKMPVIVEKSISILSEGGLGMAMFSLGLFMASQSKIIACGAWKAAMAMGARFFIGPAVMAASSFVVGLRGKLLRVAIIQAALPQGIVPFVFAKEYNLHPAILSTGVILGMLIAMPITLAYYILLGL